ncbi:MAG TPA: hypothetical protein VHG28_10815 [Longimicrobiaceae bacterium]|nr:hypothetical protein [Longimicrobiaceae bacterium]
MEPSARAPEYSFLLEPLGEKIADLTYREGDRTLIVFLKRSGDPELGWVGEATQLGYWTEPAGEPIPDDHQALILVRLAEWARSGQVPVLIPSRQETKEAFIRDLEQQGYVFERQPDGTLIGHDPKAKETERPRSLWTELKEFFFPPPPATSTPEYRAYLARQNEERRRQERLSGIVRQATDSVVAAVAGRTPRLRMHHFYGAVGVDPKHLTAWYVFDTDADHREARRNGLVEQIDTLTRAELARLGYPPEAIPKVFVSFTTDETVQREAGGDYRTYFQ